MTSFNNIPQLKQRRRALRKQPIPSEARLWMALRGRQVRGYKFRRQNSLGMFIVDFYCPKLKLAVEVDGDSHLAPGQDIRDERRQRWLESQGIHMIRFSSDDVMNNLSGVIEKLEGAIMQLEATRGNLPGADQH